MNLNTRNPIRLVTVMALALLAAWALNGCSERTLADLELASADDNPVVYEDEFLGGLDYAAFEDSYYEAFTLDQTVAHAGNASIKVAVPPNEWAGGFLYVRGTRNLSSYNALTFYARASRAVNLGSAGTGIRIAGDSPYQTEVNGLALTTEWTLYVLPIPDPSRLTLESGMFWFAMGATAEGVNIWFDDIKYARVSGITDPRPVMTTRSVQALVGDEFDIPGTRTVFNVSGEDVRVYHTPDYFTYTSSDNGVALAEGGTVTAVSLGEATVTAMLGDVEVQGEVTARVVEVITRPEVFIDSLDGGLDYAAFEGSYYEALSIDEDNGLGGGAALKFTIPTGQWAGGAFWTHEARDLSSFDALVFDARAAGNYTLTAVGFGIGMEYGTATQVEVNDIPLTADWTRVVIPIPDADRLAAEHGVFWFSTGDPGEIWFDNVQFATLETGVITDPRPVMTSTTVTGLLGEVVPVTGTRTTFAVDGEDVLVNHTAIYFDYLSSDESVVVGQNGVVTVVGGGTATVTAELDGAPVDGQITVNVVAPPTAAAPTPTLDPGDVISVFSNAYTDITVDTWRADWTFGPIEVADQQIAGDDVKAYTGLNTPAFYTGIEFVGDQIDAATPGMTHFHMDVYAPAGTQFAFKMVDFGPNGAFGGGDDTESTFTLNADSTPVFAAGEWVSLDIPLTEFAGMNFGNVSQLVLTGTNTGSLWLDNIYFHK